MCKQSMIAVVLLNWNGERDTIECIESLSEINSIAFRLIVVDNNSRLESFELIRESLSRKFVDLHVVDSVKDDEAHSYHKSALLIRNSQNLGFAGGMNVGIRMALSDPAVRYVWLLNNDTIVHPNSLSALASKMDSDESIGICGSTLIYADQKLGVQAFGGAVFSPFTGRSRHCGAFLSISDIPQNGQEIESKMDYVVGASMFVRREYINVVGFMSEDYFLYNEEIDWSTRRKDRFRLGYAPDSWVWHKEGASIGTSSSGGSPLSVYYLFRSRVIFTSKYYAHCLPSVVAFSLVEVMKFLVKRRWSQAVAALQGLTLWPRRGMPHLSVKRQ